MVKCIASFTAIEAGDRRAGVYLMLDNLSAHPLCTRLFDPAPDLIRQPRARALDVMGGLLITPVRMCWNFRLLKQRSRLFS
jgi:hypothetical protein